MNVTCPNCATIFRVDPAKVPDSGVRARCNVCSAVFAVRREATPSQPAAPEPARAPAVAPSPPPPAPPPPPQQAPPAPPPPPPQPAPPVVAPPTMAPPAAARPAMSPVGPAAPAAPSRSAAAPSRPFAPAAPASAPPASTAAPVTPARPATPGRAVNPFLSQDPALKARRLARALISDMVVYHPGKRQDGLQNGTLKELFEDEIRKSWEEYADQVGRQVADSTPYFKEALNEILAGGRQVF